MSSITFVTDSIYPFSEDCVSVKGEPTTFRDRLICMLLQQMFTNQESWLPPEPCDRSAVVTHQEASSNYDVTDYTHVEVTMVVDERTKRVEHFTYIRTDDPVMISHQIALLEAELEAMAGVAIKGDWVAFKKV